jgi:hypothetical protein
MPDDQILTLLITERDKLSRAIEALQGPTKRIGRRPKNPGAIAVVSAPAAAPAPVKKTRKFSYYQRKKQAERMKAYWAAKKKAEAKSQPKAAKKTKKTPKKSASLKKATKKRAAKKRAVKKTAPVPVQGATEA